MVADIHKLIAAISPDIYCKKLVAKGGEVTSPREQVKNFVKKTLSDPNSKDKAEVYVKAAAMAEVVDSDYTDIMGSRFAYGAFEKKGLKNPIEKHLLRYNISSQSLESIYFTLIDLIEREFGSYPDKIVDNFVSTAGSGHFAELGARASRMQEEAMKIFATANTVIRSILNIIYDLKEFKIRLEVYNKHNSKDHKERELALLSLKQVWLDQVDIKRGNTSIKGLALSGNPPQFVTLIDAFMASESLEHMKKELDLNERVTRILEQRLAEFFKWISESERELSKRFELEKVYLKSQINALKLYARWIKPYLHAARELEQRAPKYSSMVTAFNSIYFELTILGKEAYNPSGDIAKGDLPEVFKKMKFRKYYNVIIIEFQYGAGPARTDPKGGYSFNGGGDIKFTSYALTEEELAILKDQIEKSDIGDLMSYIQGATDDSLAQIQDDIDELLYGKVLESEKKEEPDDLFTGLFSSNKEPEKKEAKPVVRLLAPDSYEESVIRSQACLEARWRCRKIYDLFKKMNNMPSFPPVL